jgi:hypothetical protein
MKVVQLSTSLAGRGFSHNAGSLVAMSDEQADRFVAQGLASTSDADPDGADVTTYGQASDTLDVTEAARPETPPAGPPARTGPVSVVEPQPPASSTAVSGGTVTGLGPEHARPIGPRPATAGTATTVAGDEAPSDRVADIRAWVGDSPERARQALAREENKPEDEQRSSLVAHLRTVADAGA